MTASLTLPRTQSLKKPSTGETSTLTVGAGAASTMSSSNDVVVKDDKLSIGANSNTSVYDNVQSSASCASSASLAAKRNVAAYATLRGGVQTVTATPVVVSNEADVVVVNDVPNATSSTASAAVAAQTLTSMNVATGELQSNSGVSGGVTAIESKSSETQTVTTQTTQTPVAVASVTDQPPSAVQSITHRTTQQPLPPPNTTQQPVYPHQYPPTPFQQPQPIYGVGQPNYYNQMQQGAIPRTYPQQQQQQQQQPMAYHGMHPQQSQTLNRSGYPYPPGLANYGSDFGGTLPPQMQYTGSNRSDSGVSSYHHPHPGSIHPHHHHQQQQQHHPYYERAYSVQGDVSNDVMMHDMVNQARRSASGRPPHHHSGHPHLSHLTRRDLLSSKSVDYSSAMDGPSAAAAAAAASNGFFQDDHEQLLRAARRHRSRSTENVVANEQQMLGMGMSANAGGMPGLGSDVLKRMLQPVQQQIVGKMGGSAAGLSPNASPLTSPEMSRRGPSSHRTISDGFQSEPEISR